MSYKNVTSARTLVVINYHAALTSSQPTLPGTVLGSLALHRLSRLKLREPEDFVWNQKDFKSKSSLLLLIRVKLVIFAPNFDKMLILRSKRCHSGSFYEAHKRISKK
jgi:hypothetical protein